MKFFRLQVFVLLFFIVVSPCLGEEAKSPSTTLEIAVPIPKGMGYGVQYEKVVFPVFKEAAGGDIDLKIYWGGIQGDNETVLKKLRSGRLDGAGLDALGTMLAVREFAVLQLPFLFNDYEEVDYIREKMFPYFSELAEKNGFLLALWLDQDFDQFYTTDVEFKNPAQFSGINIANWCGPLEKETATALGARTMPVNINTIVSAIKSGEANAAIAPAIWVLGAQLHSSFRNVHPFKIRYSPAIVVITSKAWNGLKGEYQTKYFNLKDDVEQKMNTAIRRDNKKCLAAMKRYGLKIVKVDPENIAKLKELTLPVWKEKSGGLFPEEALEKVSSHLNDFRQSKKNK